MPDKATEQVDTGRNCGMAQEIVKQDGFAGGAGTTAVSRG